MPLLVIGEQTVFDSVQDAPLASALVGDIANVFMQRRG